MKTLIKQLTEGGIVSARADHMRVFLNSPLTDDLGPVEVRLAMLDRGLIEARDKALRECGQNLNGVVDFFQAVRDIATGRYFSLLDFRKKWFPTIEEYESRNSSSNVKEGEKPPFVGTYRTSEALYSCLGVQAGYWEMSGEAHPPVVQISRVPFHPKSPDYLDRKASTYVGFHDERKIALAADVLRVTGQVSNQVRRKEVPELLAKAVKRQKGRAVVWTSGEDFEGAALKEPDAAVAVMVDVKAQSLRLLLEEYLGKSDPVFTLKSGIELPRTQSERQELIKLVEKACAHTVLNGSSSTRPIEA